MMGWIAIFAMTVFVVAIVATGWSNATPTRLPLHPSCVFDCGRR
jgi:hypothetical protein